MNEKTQKDNNGSTAKENTTITYITTRKYKIPITLELLSMFGLTLFSLVISISLITIKIEELTQYFITEEIIAEIGEINATVNELNTTVNGDITQNIESLEQSVGKLEQITNNIIVPEITEIKEDVQHNWMIYNDNPLATVPLHLLIQCIDRETNEHIADCRIGIEILDQKVIYEFEYEEASVSPAYLPIERNIRISASSEGYQESIEEYLIVDSRDTELILIFLSKIGA